MKSFVFAAIFALGCLPQISFADFTDARWIGVANGDLPLFSSYLPVFKIDFDFSKREQDTVALIYGANDPRLMDGNLNVYGLAAEPDASAIRLELTGDDVISLYRYGYHPNDQRDKPFATFRSPVNFQGSHHIQLKVNLGHTDIYVDGEKTGYAAMGPQGNGGGHEAFPTLSEVMAVTSGGSRISNLEVSNFRSPGNTLYKAEGPFTGFVRIDIPQRAMPELRSDFILDSTKSIKKASVTATARGIYDMTVNGRRVSELYFLPGHTQYNKTHLYHTFDLTPIVKGGHNEVRVAMGEGWWSGAALYEGENWNFYGDRQSLLASIDIEYTDGTRDSFPTSPDTWQYSIDGPIREASFFQGEIHDATVGESERRWHQAVEIPIEGNVCEAVGDWSAVNLRPAFGDSVAVADTLTAVAVTRPRQGVYIYDLGQNIAGVPHVDLTGLPRASDVTFRYAELLYPDLAEYKELAGMLMTENLRAAMCRDQYRTRGEGIEIYSPRLTFHGFRYIEITGLDEALPLERVKAFAVSSIPRFRAGFECSDTLVNRLWQNILWSAKGNFISIPTDCPQRNERLGWMGDISVFSPTATRIADVNAILRQHIQSMRDCQHSDGRFPDVAPTDYGFGGLLWGSAGIVVPREHFRQYADTALLAEHYPAMKRYMDYIFGKTIDRATGIIVQNHEWGDLGDWLSPEYDKNDKSLLWECYLIHDLDIMEETARILGRDDDARHYREMAAERRDFFRKVYLDLENLITIHSSYDPDKVGKPVDTQASYALPIAFGIIDDQKFYDNFALTVERVNRADDGTVCPPYSLMTGFIGTAWISEALTKAGRNDLAYRLLTNTSYPSWLYPVTQGATTIWERLNSYTHTHGFGGNNGMNSFNHYSFGAVGNWLLTRTAGIDYSDGKLTFIPVPDLTGSLTWAKGWMEIPGGKAECSWHLDGDEVVVTITSPVAAEFVNPFTGEIIPIDEGTTNCEFRLMK